MTALEIFFLFAQQSSKVLFFFICVVQYQLPKKGVQYQIFYYINIYIFTLTEYIPRCGISQAIKDHTFPALMTACQQQLSSSPFTQKWRYPLNHSYIISNRKTSETTIFITQLYSSSRNNVIEVQLYKFFVLFCTCQLMREASIG